MEVIICTSQPEAASLVARHVCELVRSNPAAVLGLATEAIPQPTYAEMIRVARQEAISFGAVRAFMLHEYLGISDDDLGTSRNRIRYLTDGVGIKSENVFVLPNQLSSGPEPDVELAEECERFEKAIVEVGGIDLQLLGLGPRGRIAFNEPLSSLASRTRVKTLTEWTREVVAERFLDVEISGNDPDSLAYSVSGGTDNVPDHVVTQGVGTILDSRHAILIATGTEQAKIVAQAIEGPLSSFIPASALQLHPHATVVLDDEAARELEMKEYYNQVRQKKRYIQLPVT